MTRRFLVSQTVLIASFVISASAWSYTPYHAAECQAPEKLTYQTLAQVDPAYFPQHSRYQGGHQTCYGFVAQFLLQYLSNRVENRVENPWVPSVVDLIIRYKRNNLTSADIGHSLKILQEVRTTGREVCQDQFDQNGEGDYDRFFGDRFDLLSEAFAEGDAKVFKRWAKGLSPSGKVQIAGPTDWDSILNDIYTSPAKAYYEMSCSRKTVVPSYNLVARYLKKSDVNGNIEESNQKYLNILIEMLSHGYPVGSAVGVHTFAVTGVRNVCCGSQCHIEWQIQDSLPEDSILDRRIDHWYPAHNFSGARDIVQALPCKEGECSRWIDGTPKTDASLVTDDLEGFKISIAEKLPRGHGLSLEQSLKYLERSIQYGGYFIPLWILDSQSISPNVVLPSGLPLLHFAARQQLLDLTTELLRRKANPNQLDAKKKSLLSYATEMDYLEMIHILKKTGAK